MQQKKLFIPFIILISFSFINLQTDPEICNYYSDCTCLKCGEDRDFSNCDFINLFCEEGANTFTSNFSKYKNYYLNNFKKERNAEIFCGEQKSAIKKDQQETVIIKTGKSYTKNTKLHCYYTVIYNDFYNSYKNYNPLMTYEIEEIGGQNKLRFNLLVIYHGTNEDITDLFTDNELRNNPYSINVTKYDKVEIFLDFKQNEYSHIDETFQVKVKLNLKTGKTDPVDNKDNSESSSSGAALGGAIGGGLGGILLLGLIGFCIYGYCCGTKTYEVKEKSNCVIF